MRAFGAIAAMVFACLVAGCALPGRLAEEDVQAGKTVAVVSVLGDTFHGIRLGFTIFGNETYDVSVPDWNVDGATEQSMKSFLERDGRRKAILLEEDKGLSKRIKDRWGMLGFDFTEVLTMAKEKGAEVVIIVVPVRNDNVRFLKEGFGFLDGLIYVAAIFDVFSTQTGKKVGWVWSFPQTGRTDFEWRNGFDKYSASEIEILRELTINNIQQTVNRALGDLGY